MSTATFPIGVDVKVNSTTIGAQTFPAVAALLGGGFVVTWTSHTGQGTAGNEIRAQRYNGLGLPEGPEFTVNNTSTGSQTLPSVAATDRGGFAVTWQSNGQTDTGSEIYVRFYDRNGVAAVDEIPYSRQAGEQVNGSAASLNKNDSLVVVWASTGPAGNGYDIVGSRGGIDQGGRFSIFAAAGDQLYPSIAALNDHGFVVTFTTPQPQTTTSEIAVQRFDYTGVAQGAARRVNSHTDGNQDYSSVVTLKSNNYVVVWSSDGQDGSGAGVFGQVFSGDERVLTEFRVNDTTSGYQTYPSIAALDDGGFMVTWSSSGQDGSGWGVYGRRYGATGQALGGEFRINATTAGDQVAESVIGSQDVATLVDGKVVQVWSGTGTEEVFFRLITTKGTVANDDAYVIVAGSVLTAGSAISLLANDVAAAPPAINTVITGHGVVDTNADGTFIYFPQGFTGVDHLRYTFADPLNGSAQTANVSIYVVPVNVGATSTTLDLVGLTAEEQIAATYVAFFGRGADANGFDFWVNEFNVGHVTQVPATLFANIASSFGVSNEAKELHPFLVDPFGADIVDIIRFIGNVYNNLFNRSPDSGGFSYWIGQTQLALSTGKFVGSILVDMMSGAQDTAAGKDITILMSMVAVSLHYVEAQKELHTAWTPDDDLAEAKALLEYVTSAASTVLVGIAQADHLVAADVP